MGIYDDFGSLLPEDKRDVFKAAISSFDGAVKIDSRETAEKLAGENQYLKSAIDAAISRAVESHDVKFKAEKLPNLVAEELKKNAPKPKDPELAAALERVAALEKAKADSEAETSRMTQLAKALPVVSELGLSPKWADRLIGSNDMETEALIKEFRSDFVKARDAHTDGVLKQRFGNQAMPPMGASAPTSREALTAEYSRLMAAKQFQQALKVQAEIANLKE